MAYKGGKSIAVTGNTHYFRIASIIKVMREIKFPHSLRITFMITLLSRSFIVLIPLTGAWVLVDNHTNWSQLIFMAFMATLCLSFPAITSPLIQFLDRLTLKNRPKLIVMYGRFGLSMSDRGFIKGDPKENGKGSIIDNCSRFQPLFSIIFSLFAFITMTKIVLNSMSIWNTYLLPFLVIGNSSSKMHLLELMRGGQFGNSWELIFPAVLVTIIPIIIVILFLQRFIVQGISKGAITS